MQFPAQQLKGSSKKKCLHFVPDLGGDFDLSPLSLMLAVDYSYMSYVRLRKFPSVPSLLNIFIMKECWILSDAFLHSLIQLFWDYTF